MTEELSFEQKSTLWVGGISDQVDEEILYELFQNAGPLTSVKIPVDKETKRQKNFAFIRFAHEESVPYAAELFQDVKLFGRFLRMQNKDTGVGMPKNDNRYQQQRSYNGDDRRRNDRDQERSRDRDRNSRERDRGNSRNDQDRNDRERDYLNDRSNGGGMANHHRSLSAPQMMNNGQFNFAQDGPFQMPVSPLMMNQQQRPPMNPFQMQMFQQQQMMRLMQQQQQNGGGFNSYQNQQNDRRNRDDHRNNRRSGRYDDRNRDRSRSDDRRDRSYDRRSNNRR